MRVKSRLGGELACTTTSVYVYTSVMDTTARVDKELAHQARIIAVTKGYSLKTYIERALRAQMARDAKRGGTK